MHVVYLIPAKSFLTTLLRALTLRTESFPQPDKDTVEANELLPVTVFETSYFFAGLDSANTETPIILKSRIAIINKTQAAVVVRMLDADMTRNQVSLVGKFIT